MPSTEKKFKAFALVTYAVPETVTEILEKKYNEGALSAYAHILHDKDVHEDGTRKEPHTHIVITSNEYRTLTGVLNWFKATRDFKGEIANTRGEAGHISKHQDGTETFEPVDVKGATYYLVHEDKEGNPLPKKHHYDWSEVISRNLELLKNPPVVEKGRPEKEDHSFEIFEHMLKGTMKPYELAKKYGRDFILNYRKYGELVYACIQEEDNERVRQAEADYKQKQALLDSLGTVEPHKDDIIRLQDNEIERLRAMLHANGIHDIDTDKTNNII